MTTREVHEQSREFVKIKVTQPADNTYDPAVIEAKVGDGAWRPTDVLTARDPATGVSRVGFIVEPLVDALPAGRAYEVLIRLVDTPEAIVFQAGDITVTR